MHSYNKFKNKPTFVDGIRFASKKEGERYKLLKLLEKNGDIQNLKLQPVFKFPVGFSYRADFQYSIKGSAYDIVEDTKGFETKEFLLKKKCFEYFYPNLELRIIK